MIPRRIVCIGFFILWAVFPATAQINADNVTLMGRNALAMDDYVTAIHYFNQVIAARPNRHAPYYYRAYAKFSLEDYVGAEADCTKALELNPYMGEIYQLRGLCRIHNEKFQGAIEDYTQSLKEEPDDQGAIYNRALCRLELKDFKTADEELDLLLNKWKNFQRAYLVKAQIAMETHDTLKSLTWVDRLLEINPRNEDGWAFKGRYALSKAQFKEADSCMTEAIELNPNGFEHYIVRAQARHGMLRFAEALHDYDRTLEIIPEHFVAHYNRGLLRALVGDKNRAITDFDFVLQVEPDNTLAIYNRALLREETGDYNGAISDYSALIEVYPHFTYGYMARANCRRKTGDISGAIRDESVVAKAQLDMKYKPHQRRPIQKVRQRSDHSLDQYQQLVEEQPDTTRRFVNQLMGKIQNRKVEQQQLPEFTFALRRADAKTNLRTVAFLPEMDAINRLELLPVPVSFATGSEGIIPVDELTSGMSLLSKHINNSAAAHFMKSMVHANLYDFEEALQEINLALEMDSLNYIYPLHAAAICRALQRSEPKDLTGKETKKPSVMPQQHRPKYTQLALHHLEQALALSPHNAYVLYNRGCLRAEMQQKAEAIRDFSAALVADPHLAEARFNRALVYLSEGKLDAAILDLSHAGEDGLYKAYNLLKQATQMKNAAKREQKKKERIKELEEQDNR